ncbi:protein PHYTOCHROME KINASE SUBSTRATE 1 [Punica granatum]|nr:protein PHYTOCHROME KINASE SUBSTRATE 1 [Punica granatum]OWM75947.1 hypothetical protein CDL15_Pgr009592 [Punica granatum]
MAMVNVIQSSNSELPWVYSLNSTEVGNNRPRDVSFSSYLNPSEETFVHKLVQSGRSLSFTSEPEKEHEHLYYLGRKEEDGEIGVFEAEKYFNGEIDCESDDSLQSAMPLKKLIHFEDKKEEREGERLPDIVTKPARARLPAGTPSTRSESSLNSQRALLQNVTKNPVQKKDGKVNSSRSILAAIGCKCSCSDKDSVDVVDDENTAKFITSLNAKSNAVGVFPTHSNGPTSDAKTSEEIQSRKAGKFGHLAPKTFLDLPSLKPEDEEVKPRKSLEVFGSPLYRKKGNDKETYNLERRLTMLSTWDANPRKAESDVVNETESDASSDLFEIESLTGKVNSYLTRQTSDATSDCLTPTTARYPPSEVSIEWSVVTASAADFSVLSDLEEAISGPLVATKGIAQAKNRTEDGQRWRPRSGILLGCKSQKAVRVAGEAHKFSKEKFRSDPRMGLSRKLNLSADPVARFQAEARLTGFDPKYRKHASHLLYVGN